MPRSSRSRAVVETEASESVRSHRLQGRTLLVALSGGADSTALLHALHNLREALGLTLHVAHFDHNFRPEAAEDARFAASKAQQLGLPFITEHADPIAYQREHGISSFEAAARELRYRFLGRAAESIDAAAVALGHNADDQAETVLMHLLRGSGLDGLRGMDALSNWRSSDDHQQVNLFRALLTVTKDQLRQYCEDRDIPYREDPANLDTRFTRNRVRHQLLPSLREYNPRISEALVRLAQTASQETGYLEEQAAHAWTLLAHPETDKVTLNRASLVSLPVALQVRLLRKSYETLVGSRRRLQASHIDAMMALVQGGSGREIALPLGLRVRATHETLTMGHLVSSVKDRPFDDERPLAVPSSGVAPAVSYLPNWKITLEWADASSPVPPDPSTATLDVGRQDPELSLRGRRRGDRFHPYGMPGEKKLQDFLVDRKVPASQRDSIPLLALDGRLAWVVGQRVAQWAAVRPESKFVLRISFTASPEAQS